MTLREMIIQTGALPVGGETVTGIKFEIDVARNGRLGYMARMWEVKGLGVKEYVIEYGTGQTAELAMKALKNKILTHDEL